jgi:hypothetical protein
MRAMSVDSAACAAVSACSCGASAAITAASPRRRQQARLRRVCEMRRSRGRSSERRSGEM